MSTPSLEYFAGLFTVIGCIFIFIGLVSSMPITMGMGNGLIIAGVVMAIASWMKPKQKTVDPE